MKEISKKLLRSICMTFILTMMISCISPLNVDAKKKTKTGIKSATVYVDNHKYNNKTYVLEKGKSKKLSIVVKPSGKFKTSYKSSKKNFVTISKSGKITGKKVGKSQISIRIKKGKKTKIIKFVVKVIEPSKPATQPSKPVVTPPVVKPEEPKPIDPTPEEPKPVDPTPEEPDEPDEPDVNWKTCQHDWGVGCKHQEIRCICHGCKMDYEDIEHHMDVEEAKDFFTNCAGYGTHNVAFYECSICGAGKKHIPDWDSPTTGRDFIYATYEECLAYTQY